MYNVMLKNNTVYTDIHFPSSDPDAPHLTMLTKKEKDSAADILEFTIFKNNPGYNQSYEITTDVLVIDIRDDSIEFDGRVLKVTEQMDSNGSFYKKVTAEGSLNYLIDSKTRKCIYDLKTPTEILTDLLSKHNSKVSSNRQIQLGNIEITNATTIQVSYQSTLSAIQLIKNNLGGHFKVRLQNGIRYLDYFNTINTNILIQLGENMKDMLIENDINDIGTRLIPIGRDELTIESVNNNIDYIDNQNAIDKYGVIEKVVEYDNIEDPAQLKAQMMVDINKYSQPKQTLESSALDLSVLSDNSVDKFTICKNIRILNPVMNIDTIYEIVEVDVDLLKPYNPNLTISNIPDNLTKQIVELNNTTSLVNKVTTNDGKINTNYLDGVIDVLKNQLIASGAYSNVQVVDDKGLLFENTDSQSDDYGALYLGPGIFAIANSKTAEGNWSWRSFGTGNGFTADELVAGVLRGGKVFFDLENGVFNIDNKFVFDGASLQIKFSETQTFEEKINQVEQDTNGRIDDALSTLDQLSSDSKLTPTEKQQVKIQWDSIVSEKASIDSQADIYLLVDEKNTYDSSYDDLNTYITDLLLDLTTTSNVDGAVFRDKFKSYYNAKNILLSIISTIINTKSDDALDALADMSDDSKLTPVEKLELSKTWEIIKIEKLKIDVEADSYSIIIEKENYNTSYSVLETHVTPLLLDATVTSAITRSDHITKLTDYYNSRQLLLNAISNKAKDLADQAQSDANTANELLTDIASDNKLTPVEKTSLKKEWDVLVSEKIKMDNQAITYGIDTEKTEYDNAYTYLSNYITPLLAALNDTSDMTGSTLRANFKSYYDTKQELLNVISSKAKSLADDAQSTANDLKDRVIPQLTTRVNTVEQKVTPDAIVSTVSRSMTYYKDTFLPKPTNLILSRNGLAINPLMSYNPTSLQSIPNNNMVSISSGTQSYIPSPGGLQIVDDKSVTFDRQVDRVEEVESNITQHANEIALVVKDGSVNTASIVASLNDVDNTSKIAMNAMDIDLTGLVTFNSFDTDTKSALETTTAWTTPNKTTINGAKIETGSLKVNQIAIGGDNGTISWDDINKTGATASDVGAIGDDATGHSTITTLTKTAITTGTMILDKLYTSDNDYYIGLAGSKFAFLRASDNAEVFSLSALPETNVGEANTITATRVYLPDGCSIDTTEGSFRMRVSKNNYLRINQNGGLDYVYPTDGNGGTSYNQITIVDSSGVLQTGTGSTINVTVTPRFG